MGKYKLRQMSASLEVLAPAKTNLWLRILGKREDGYHEIDTRMVRLDLADRLRLVLNPKGDGVSLRCDDPALPTDEENLVIKAVRVLERYLDRRFDIAIDLEKLIPSGAGLGGGSSDAAAVMRGLNTLAELGLSMDELATVGAKIGSDVPFFIYDRCCDCRGRGEIIEFVDETETPPSLPFFLYKPGFSIAASWAYGHFAESVEYPDFQYEPQVLPWGDMQNDLERPVFDKFPVLGDLKNWLLAREEVQAALLSGSGSTVFAVLRDGIDPCILEQDCLQRYGDGGWTWVGRSMPS